MDFILLNPLYYRYTLLRVDGEYMNSMKNKNNADHNMCVISVMLKEVIPKAGKIVNLMANGDFMALM